MGLTIFDHAQTFRQRGFGMATVDTPKVMLPREMFPWLTRTAWNHVCEYAPTFLTEFAVMACQIVTYKLAAHFLGKQGFSEYAVARRAISTIYPVGLLGLGVALPRYIAISSESGGAGLCDRFYGVALRCIGLTMCLIFALINFMPSKFAYLIYGDASYKALAVPISMVLTGLILHAIVYSYFRGHLLMNRANILQFANLGTVPLLAFLPGDRSLEAILRNIGLFSIAISLVALASTPWREIASGSFAEVKILMRYGIPRVPGDFAHMALLGLPAFFVAHSVGVQEAGLVAFGISILSMISAIFAPVGLVLLPKSSLMLATGATAELRRHVLTLVKTSVVISAVLTTLVFLFANPLIHRYLGVDFGDAARVARILCLGAVPYSVFLVIRNVLDAFHDNAVTSLLLVVALGVLALTAWPVLVGHANWNLLLLSFLIALTVLGGLATLEARRVFQRLEVGAISSITNP